MAHCQWVAEPEQCVWPIVGTARLERFKGPVCVRALARLTYLSIVRRSPLKFTRAKP